MSFSDEEKMESVRRKIAVYSSDELIERFQAEAKRFPSPHGSRPGIIALGFLLYLQLPAVDRRELASRLRPTSAENPDKVLDESWPGKALAALSAMPKDARDKLIEAAQAAAEAESTEASKGAGASSRTRTSRGKRAS